MKDVKLSMAVRKGLSYVDAPCVARSPWSRVGQRVRRPHVQAMTVHKKWFDDGRPHHAAKQPIGPGERQREPR